jgi:glycosyltransferase involved in cell wall biosynthesis
MRRLPVHICLSLGRVRSFEEGLGEFALQLGRELANQTTDLVSRGKLVLHFHARKNLHGCFGDKFTYHDAKPIHRWFHPSFTKFDIWHVLHQLNTTLPAGDPAATILTVHDLNFLYLDTPVEISRRLRKTQKIIERADHIAAISEYTRSDMIKYCTISQPTCVIKNGVADLTMTERTPIVPLIGKNYLLHISRLAKSKNVASILEMAAIWPEQMFVIAGPDGRDKEELAVSVAANALRNVVLLPSVTVAEKAWLYANCTGFLFPSIAEGFGLPPIEAMYFGKPIFVSSSTVLPEICGEHAFYFSSFEPAAMRAAVQSGLEQALLKNRQNEIAKYARTFSWEQAATQYLRLYKSAWAARQSSASWPE